MNKVTVRGKIGHTAGIIEARSVTIATPIGTLDVGVDNDGEVYLSTGADGYRMSIIPAASNRIIVRRVEE